MPLVIGDRADAIPIKRDKVDEETVLKNADVLGPAHAVAKRERELMPGLIAVGV